MHIRIKAFVFFAIYSIFLVSCNQGTTDLLPHEQSLIQAFQSSFNEHLEDSFPDSALSIALAVKNFGKEINDLQLLYDASYQAGIIFFSRNENDSAIACLEICREQAQKLDNPMLIAQTRQMMGTVLLSLQQYAEARTLIFSALEYNMENNNQPQLAANYSSVGLIYDELLTYDSALIYYQKAATVFDSIGDIRNQAVVLGNIAGINISMENYGRSIETLGKTIPMNIQVDNRQELLSNYNRMGLAYLNLKEYDSAFHYFEQSYLLADLLNDEFSKLIANFNKGKTLALSGHYKEANDIVNKVYQFCIENDIPDGQLRCLLILGQNDIATLNYRDANQKLTKGLQIAVDYKYPYFEREFLLELNRLQLASNATHFNQQFFERFLKLNDSIELTKMKEKVLELETRFEASKKEQQMAIYKKDMEVGRLRFKLMFIVALLIVLSSLLVLIILSRRHQNLQHRHQLAMEQNKRHQISIESSRLEHALKDNLIEMQENKLSQKDQELVYNALTRAKSIEFFHRLKERILTFQNRFVTRKDQYEFRQIIEQMEAANNLNAMEQFEKIFKELHPGFYKNLTEIHPGLSGRELQLCAMLRLNMTTKNIAAVTFLAPTTIDTARHRIRKKMKLDSDTGLINELLKY